MNRRHKFSFILVGAGLVFSLLLHFGIMYDRISLEPKYVLYIHLFMIVVLWPVMSISKDTESDVYIENTFKTAVEVLPLWLIVGLGVILVYSAIVFVNFTYIHKPLAEKTDITGGLTKFNKGSSAATMFFYTSAFGLLNLHWRVKKLVEQEATDENQEDNHANEP